MAKVNINLSSGTVEKNATKEIIIGIDLGTTNSLVSYVDEDGTPKVIGNSKGEKLLVPSVLLYDNGTWIVGDKAKEKLTQNSESAIYSIKRLLGKSFSDLSNRKLAYNIYDGGEGQLVKIEIDGHFFNPIELSSIILKELKTRVENDLKLPVSKAVITVPAYFDDTQRQATRDAGKLAGLDVLRIINEPTAASLAYGYQKDDINQIIAVYDLGGGTFDVSILRLEEGIYEVLTTSGDTDFGGDNFDEMIVEYWQNQFEIKDLPYSRLRIEAENAKVALSKTDHFNTTIDSIELTLSLIEFNNIIKSKVDYSIGFVNDAIKEAKLSTKEIDKVILVGGSTRIPLIKTTLENIFGDKVSSDLNPDLVVSLGAAIQADVLAGNNPDVLLIDITPLSLGIETVGGLMDVIIPRNSKIPNGAGRQYTTSVDGQTNLKVSIYQGERDMVENNRKLGEFILSNIPPMPAGIPKIEIHFLIDANGVLIVRAKELRSEKEQEIEIKSQFGISDEEMGRMLVDSIKNAASDKDIKALKETQNEANNIILATNKFIKQNNSWLTKEESNKLVLLNDTLKEETQGKNKDKIQSAIESLNEYSSPFAQIAMEKAIKTSLRGKSIDNS